MPLEEKDLAFNTLEDFRNAYYEADDKLTMIENWCKAYPLDMFPEPDLKRAATILKAHGMRLDEISASNMRHVLTGIQKIIDGEI